MGCFTAKDVVSLVCVLSFLSAISASRVTPMETKTHGLFSSKTPWTQVSWFFVLCFISVRLYLVLKEWVRVLLFDLCFVRVWCVLDVLLFQMRVLSGTPPRWILSFHVTTRYSCFASLLDSFHLQKLTEVDDASDNHCFGKFNSKHRSTTLVSWVRISKHFCRVSWTTFFWNVCLIRAMRRGSSTMRPWWLSKTTCNRWSSARSQESSSSSSLVMWSSPRGRWSSHTNSSSSMKAQTQPPIPTRRPIQPLSPVQPPSHCSRSSKNQSKG